MRAALGGAPCAHAPRGGHPAPRRGGGGAAAAAAAAPPGAAVPAPAAPPPPLPASFRRLVARRTGASFAEVAAAEDAPLPALGEGDALVRVRYAGVNGGCETFRARGDHAFGRNRGAPWFALGAEGVGEVAALGAAARGAPPPPVAVGQPVSFVGGAFAEFVVAPAASLWPLAAATPAAAALAISGTAAAAALHGVARAAPGEAVLVTAAAGATGHLAVQIAKAHGCRVVAAVRGGRKAAALRALPPGQAPDVVVDVLRQDLGAALAAAFPAGVDVAYEGVGGGLHRAAWRALAPGGRLLQVGYISEYPHALLLQQQQQQGEGARAGPGAAADDGDWPLPPLPELFWGGLTVEAGGRTAFGSVWPRDRAETRRCKALVHELHAAGRLDVWVDEARFRGVEACAAAVEFMLSGQALGKVVVEM